MLSVNGIKEQRFLLHSVFQHLKKLQALLCYISFLPPTKFLTRIKFEKL